MSSINREIVTTFAARGGAQVRAVMGEVMGGLNGMLRSQRDLGRQTSYLNSQMRAFGTTLRYSIAGAGLYGAFGGVSTLSQIQKQLGLISAIGDVTTPQGRGMLLVGESLRTLGEESRTAAVAAITPITDMNAAVLNFLSTVQNVPRPQLIPIVEEIAKSSMIAQVAAEDATKAFTTMNIASGRENNLKNVRSIANEFAALISLAPGGRTAGHEIIGQLGPLSSLMALGRGTPEQMMALTLGSLRFGGTPSTSMRGLQFLMQSLIAPQTKEQVAALSGMGVTPESIAQEGIWTNLMRFLGRINPRKSTRQVAGFSDESLEALEGNPEAAGRALGIGAAESRLLNQAIGRIHGVRAAVVLAAQLEEQGNITSLQQNLEIMDKAQKGQLGDTLDLVKMWQRLEDEAILPRTAIAISALQQDLISTLEPFINYAGEKIIGARDFTSRHHDLAVYGGLGTIGAVMAGRRISGRGFGFRGAARGLLGVNAAESMMSGDAAIGASPTNPLYVVVVGQLLGPGGAGMPSGVILPPGAGGATGARPGRMRRLGRAAGRAAWPVAGLMAVGGAGEAIFDHLGINDVDVGISRQRITQMALRRPEQVEKILDRLKGNISLDAEKNARAAEEARRAFEALERRGGGEVKGELNANITLNYEDLEGNKKRKSVRVPVALEPKFKNGITPQTRGKDRTMRGGLGD